MRRSIEPKMVDFLDMKLKTNGLAQHSIEIKDARTLFGLAAEACVGIREKSGNNDGPMVELIQKTIGGADNEPWCMSFMQTCLAYAEEKTGIESPIIASEHVRTTWNETPVAQRVKAYPLKYAIICWGYEGKTSGHTGVLTDYMRNSWMATVEGNTGDSNMREGDGVYAKKRNWHRTGSLIRLGFLMPFAKVKSPSVKHTLVW
jgi:hypothetical protein